jgi:CheY-like chemotaxis protein
MRVLLIDAEATERDARAAWLRDAGFQVAGLQDVAAAAAETLEPQLVLLRSRGNRETLAADIRALRGLDSCRAEPLVVMGEGLGPAVTALASGADDFWDEPMDEATFRFMARSLKASRAPLPHQAPREPTIVVADDDQFFRERTKDALEECGCRVVAVSTGAELLKVLENGPRPALVVLDFYMPGLGGRELLVRLKENPRWSVVPVVLMSAVREDAAFAADLKRLGAAAFVGKASTDLPALVNLVMDQVSPPTLVRRRAPRASTFGLAQFRKSPEEPWTTGFVYNLGPSGAFLRTTVPAPLDSTVHVRLQVPQGVTNILAVARVAWSRGLSATGDSYYGMGIQFAELSSEALRALADMVELHPVVPPPR